MKNLINNKYLQGVLVGLVGIIAVMMMLYVNVSQLGGEVDRTLVASIMFQSGVQVFLMTFLSWVIGKTLALKMDLEVNLKVNKKEIINSVVVGLIIAVVLIAIDKFVLKVFMQEYEVLVNGFLGRLYQVLYSGIIEEIWFRLGLMTLISYAAYSILFKSNAEKRNISIIIGIVLTVIIFYLINFINIQTIYYLQPVVIAKTIIQFVIPPIIYSYIYWKKGLLYSIVAHVSMLIMLNFILAPILIGL